MLRKLCGTVACLCLSVVALAAAALGQVPPPSKAPSLSTAPAEELMRVYGQLRSLQGSDQSGVAENVAWKRDAGTFAFKEGKIAFAAPVGGRVLAAVFTGQGTFELDPPTAIDKQQIARFAKGPKLVDDFRQAVFFFTDSSWDELAKLVHVRAGGQAQAATKAIESAQRKYQEDFNDWW